MAKILHRISSHSTTLAQHHTENDLRAHRTALAAALLPICLASAHAAGPVQIQLTGNVVNFLAVTEVKGFNCSQYNPCNPTDPAYSGAASSVSFGALANGQQFNASIALDPSTRQVSSSTWTSTDGKASYGWPDGSIYSYYQQASFSVNGSNQDVLTLFTETPTKNGSRPSALSSQYNLTFMPGTLKGGAITGDELAAAITEEKLLSTTGSATFDSCNMVQNYWGPACGGRMTYAIAGVSINGVVPEPQTWATLLLGLGLIATLRLNKARHHASGSAA
jgi:hypothetical protein